MVLLNLRALALTITTKTRLQPSSTLTKRTLAPLGSTFAFGDIRTPSYDRNFSLFASGNNQANEVSFATKDRQEELQKLATTLDVDTSKVKDLLKQQALKPNLDPERTKYIQWLLGSKSKSAPATQQESPPPPAQQQSVQNANLHSSTKFNDIESLHPMTKKAIAEMLPHEYMTDIQAQTYHVATTGKDVLGRARTGTGKTLAFLLPALQCILDGTNAYKNGKMIGIVVISPTRELATQIGDQAQKLIQHHPELSCMVMYGGTNMKRDITRLNKKLPTILVTTPGRFIDHLENTSLGGQKFGHDIMRLTSTLVLDEADRLMDMGFQKAIQTIMKYLPAKDNRQTLLFSATVPKDVKLVMANYMSHDYVEVDCIGGSGDSEFENESHTNIQVQQSHVVLPTTDHYVTSVVQIVKEFQKQKDHKLVVFFSTARAVGFFAAFFNQGLGIDVFELHSRKKQGYRDRVSKQFRNSKSGILFTSDVSARGKNDSIY
jgi:ATP-dependent RNA helicase MSS116